MGVTTNSTHVPHKVLTKAASKGLLVDVPIGHSWPLHGATPIHVSYNSVSVYYFYYYILKLYLFTTPPCTSWVTRVLFVATTVYSVCGHSYKLKEHMYCLWPLLQIVSTHVLFLATTMNSLQCTPPM